MKYFDSTTRKAFYLLVGIVVILFLIQLFNSEKFTKLNLAISFTLDIMWAASLILAVKFVKEYRLGSQAISVWGFFWRSILAKYIGLFLAVILFVMLPFRFPTPSIEHTITLYCLAMVISVITVWALFSVNRRAQLFLLIGGFRGI